MWLDDPFMSKPIFNGKSFLQKKEEARREFERKLLDTPKWTKSKEERVKEVLNLLRKEFKEVKITL